MTHFSKVRVEIRIKPTQDDILDITSTSVSIDKKHFEFDRVYSSQTKHQEIFANSVLPLTQSFLNLYNSTVFAYGQTGSGKTFTMGISLEALEEYERYINKDSETANKIENSLDDLSMLTNSIVNDSKINNKKEVSDLPSSENNLNYSLQHFNIDNTNNIKIINNSNNTYNTDNTDNTNNFNMNVKRVDNHTERIIDAKNIDTAVQDNTITHENINTTKSHNAIHCDKTIYYGIVPDSFGYIFKNKKENDKFSITLLEIYNEEVIDLLSEFRNVLTLRQINGETNIAGAREMYVKDEKQAISIVKRGLLERTVKSTKMNILSSRSHAILTLNLYRNTNSAVKTSKFTFVDLAGSERMKRTLAQGTTAKESISINGGLLALSNVITALSKKSLFIPYRDSKLTRILQHGLGGNSNTLMIVNISGSSKDVSETFNTLKYANRASSISNQIKKCIEIDVNRTGVLFLKNENNRLKNENNELRNRLKNRSRSVEEERFIDINKENHKLREEVRRLHMKEKVNNIKDACKCKEYIKEKDEYVKERNEHAKERNEYIKRINEYERRICEYENEINRHKQMVECDKENTRNNKNRYNSSVIEYDDCKKKRIVTFDLEKNKIINKNYSDEVIFGTGAITKKESIGDMYDAKETGDNANEIADNTNDNRKDTGNNTNDIGANNGKKNINVIDSTNAMHNNKYYAYDTIEMKEPFILCLLIHNNHLYASTLNGKIFEIKQSKNITNNKTNSYNAIVNENDEIKKIVSYKNEIYYSHKNTIKKVISNENDDKVNVSYKNATHNIIVQVENEISIFGIKKDFLIIGTVNGLFIVYEMCSNAVKLLFSEKIFTSTILCYTRNVNYSNSAIYVGSKDNKIACMKRDSIFYFHDVHYSAVQCLLSIDDILISCGRDGCIKIYKNCSIVYTKEMAHSGCIKSAVMHKTSTGDDKGNENSMVNDNSTVHNYSTIQNTVHYNLHLFTGGKDGALKHWTINTINYEIQEIGCVYLNSCINDLVYEDGILYAACMNRNICRIRIVN